MRTDPDILQPAEVAKESGIKLSAYGFPIFRCSRPVGTEDVWALDDEE